MKPQSISIRTRVALFATLSGLLVASGLSPVQSADMPTKGVTRYVTHFIFRPVEALDVPGLGKATLLEAVGTTENMNGEKMLDKMSARCTALSVDSGPKKYIDGACVLADTEGDMIFSTFDTRATSTHRSPTLTAARTLLRRARANIRASPVVSPSLAMPCLT
jgi:hypothetical protein